jgi:hypothetical protein
MFILEEFEPGEDWIMFILEEFEPGDCTCYVMCLVEIPQGHSGTGRLGIFQRGGYILTIPNINKGIVLVFSKGEYLDLSYIESKVGNIHTAIAIAKWLDKVRASNGVELEVGQPA